MAEVFSFLVTTDNHMGFREDDHIRRKDSYKAFEEALRISRDRDVDFVLLGGDLFHVNRPSANVEHKCIKIIRQHMNAKVNRGTSFRCIKGRFSHFHKVNHANFEDKNLTVPHPIMTIHGNHDDPTGPSSQSVCEKLATCGLLNYFGALERNKKDIVIEPIVLEKVPIKIALYGLGFIPDYKLKLAFDKGEVVFVEPPRDTFNVLVVHQNRIPFNKNKYIPDELFPTFFHLIVRGHEHATQLPEPIPESQVNGIVYQPGSTVATSISMMEAAPKRVGLISVRINDSNGSPASLYKMDHELIELKSCRPMILRDISQKTIFKHIKTELGETKVTSAAFRNHSKHYVEQCIEEWLREHEAQLKNSRDDDQASKRHRFDLPLVRVRLEYASKSERFDELDVGCKFYPTRVANKNIVIYKKQKLVTKEGEDAENTTFIDDGNDEDETEEFEYINLGEEKRDTIDVMIESFFKDKPLNMRLQALSLKEYTDAVKGSAEDGNVISKVLNKKKQQVLARYKAEITDEQTAKLKFHDEELVHKWFLSAFNNNEFSFGGDDVEDMDVVICS